MDRKPFGLLGLLPAGLRGVVLDFEWDRDRLRKLDLPVETMAVGELGWLLPLPLWSYGGVPFTVSPDQVRADPGRYHVQHSRVMAADLAYPLHVLVSGCRVVTVLDGVHRLLKADLLGGRAVSVKKVPEAWLDLLSRA